MPVLDQTTSNSYTGNGVTTGFAYTFKLLDSADVLVTVDGVTKTLTTHYTVSGVGASGGGNITFLAAPANAAEVVIQRDMDYLRETDYQDNGDLLAATLDEDIDRVVMQVQQVRDVGIRSIKIPAGETTDQLITEAAADRANKAVIFDASGNVTVSTDDFEDQLANVTAQAVAAAASASSASGSASTATTQAGIATIQANTATSAASTATTQAGIATTQAGNASTSAIAAQTAETNAETAETNAEAALADALVIYGSIAAVQSAASDAAASASAAQTAETNAETAETNAEAAAAAALVSENAAEAAYNASIAIYGSLGAVQAAQSSASASATAASDSATTAIAQAAAAAASALSAGSVVSQDLSAIDRTVFAATIVDTFLYDTSKDSDGGAWRHRCGHTSWEAETLSGNWLGSAANEAAARAIGGATTGSYYYDTTAAGFYTLNAGSGKTATYRGNVRQFPAKVLITAEANRVVIWDLTQSDCPMWMVFLGAASILLGWNTIACVAVLDGVLCVGDGTYFLNTIKFLTDTSDSFGYAQQNKFNGNIAQRNLTLGKTLVSTTGLVVDAVNDVAMTVLPNAPVDVATGLPVPTIAVATDGNATYSTSVIKDDGTVVNVASDSTGTAVGVEFDGLALKVIRSDGNVYYWNDVRALTTGASPSATVSASTTPAALGTASKQAKRALSSSTGLTLMIRNQLTLASSMLAYITKSYNTGWMVGDIRGAWLADTVAETLTGTELVTNGTFATDTTGWTISATKNHGTVTWDALGIKLTSDGSGSGEIAGNQTLTTVVGKTYVLSIERATGTVAAGGAVVTVGTTVDGNQYGSIGGTATTGRFSLTFVATGTAVYIGAVAASATPGQYGIFDNISCRLADVDRSVKAKGLQAFGSLTKAAVASGAALMGYSGFSAANYLEQPYNSDLDFGTGDFYVMGWLIEAPNSTYETIFCRGAYSGAVFVDSLIYGDIADSGVVRFVLSNNGGATNDTATTPTAVDTSAPTLVGFIRRGAGIEIWLNGAVAATAAVSAAAGSLSKATATLQYGRRQSTGAEFALTNGTLALWRAGAGAPSAEQIAKIYRDELPLFQANAACTLAGSSNAVTALAYDDETDLLHVGTSYGRSAFKGLVRVSSEATPVGAITALAASAGVVVQGGASGADVYVPAYTLREELLRDAEQMAKFGQNLVAHDFTATASQTTFTLPVGWEIVAVYQQGAIKRETTSWTRSFDGFKWSAVLGTGATVSDWISILAKRV